MISFVMIDQLCSPVFVVANVLVLSSPPALTLAQVRPRFSGLTAADLCPDHTGGLG